MASRTTASLDTAGAIESEDLPLREKSDDDSSKRGSTRSAWRSRLANSFRRKRPAKRSPKDSCYMEDASFVYTPVKPSPPTQALQNKCNAHISHQRKSRQLSCPNALVSGETCKGGWLHSGTLAYNY